MSYGDAKEDWGKLGDWGNWGKDAYFTDYMNALQAMDFEATLDEEETLSEEKFTNTEFCINNSKNPFIKAYIKEIKNKKGEVINQKIVENNNLSDDEIATLRDDVFQNIHKGNPPTYESLHLAFSRICRWLRPREVLRIVKEKMEGAQIHIYELPVKTFGSTEGITNEQMRYICGERGVFFDKITMHSRIFYIWFTLQSENEYSQHNPDVIKVYGYDYANVMLAVKAVTLRITKYNEWQASTGDTTQYIVPVKNGKYYKKSLGGVVKELGAFNGVGKNRDRALILPHPNDIPNFQPRPKYKRTPARVIDPNTKQIVDLAALAKPIADSVPPRTASRSRENTERGYNPLNVPAKPTLNDRLDPEVLESLINRVGERNKHTKTKTPVSTINAAAPLRGVEITRPRTNGTMRVLERDPLRDPVRPAKPKSKPSNDDIPEEIERGMRGMRAMRGGKKPKPKSRSKLVKQKTA